LIELNFGIRCNEPGASVKLSAVAISEALFG
jgi:hypothetical protein